MKLTHKDRVACFLYTNDTKTFSNKELCKGVASMYPEIYMEKLLCTKSKDRSPYQIIAGLITTPAEEFSIVEDRYTFANSPKLKGFINGY